MYQYLIPAFALVACLLLRFRSGRWWNPVSLMIVWWAGLLWLSTYGFTDLILPSPMAVLATLTMLGGFLVGGLLVRKPVSPTDATHVDAFETRFRSAFPWIAGVSALMVVPVFVRAIQGFMTYSLGDYKGYAFGTLERPGFLFQSQILESLYFIFSGPPIFLLLLVGMALFFLRGEWKVLVAAVGFTLLDSIMRMGRINVYMTCLLVAVGAVLVFGNLSRTSKSYLLLKKRLVVVVLSIAVLAGGLVTVGFLRGDQTIVGAREHFNVFLVDYHTIGFLLFDHELKNPESPLNQKLTYGRLTVGGLENLATILIRRFDRTYNSPALENMVRLSSPVTLGTRLLYRKIEPKDYNSYYTILYTFFSDGRFPGLFIGGLLIGWITALCYAAWLAGGGLAPLSWLFFMLNIGVLGIFVSPLENMRTWLTLIGMLLLQFGLPRGLKHGVRLKG